ncbi:MAG: DUF1800 domain-containing protein [Saprospiraceae bacterium]|nr:DUF1800 domain-containing protein [Saprospiraceae bacterium]
MRYLLNPLIFVFIFFNYGCFAQKQVVKKFPYAASGLTERQAAEHLLSKFTFGVRDKDIDAAIKMGLENWFFTQLDGNIADPDLDKRLSSFPGLKMSNKELVNTYSLGAQLRKRAIDEGLVSKEDVTDENKEKLREIYRELKLKHGVSSAKELENQTIHQKIVRAVYSQNQIHEILTDFWFNHFNVFMGKNQTSRFVLSYERDAIRPHVVGYFKDMLISTAQSPAMLTYLDNFLSMAENEDGFAKRKMNKKSSGLNENYAREIMELHTLGVDGGYTQDDVRNAAKILTGWTIYPMGDEANNKLVKFLDRIGEDRLVSQGFVHHGDFLFVPNRHEKGQKIVLGVSYDQGGYDEGLQLLDNLAKHPSTARFICQKLATRFTNDRPDETLIKHLSEVFIHSGGNIREVLSKLVYHESFWNKNAIHQKIKSPFEYTISAMRILQVEIHNPAPISNWITKMGQKLYNYQAPTGFPDQGKYWINTGSLLNRMNFGLDLANGKIRGISYDPEKLLQNQEPESVEDAIFKIGKRLLPERNIQSTVERLTPLVSDPSFSEKVNKAAGTDQEKSDEGMDEVSHKNMAEITENSKITHVLGMLIGSPEFQRK